MNSSSQTFRFAICVLTLLGVIAPLAQAQDVSAPATLQLFEAKWTTIEDRMADIFQAGYGAMWLPPPSRADSGNLSVGYDVYDRFDLGGPKNATLYGTEAGIKSLVGRSHQASVNVYTDMILNHAGFSDLTTFDDNGTPTDLSDDTTFADAGGYPGLAITLPGDIDGDFHGAFESGDLNGRISGLADIAQEKNHQFIRSPVAVGDPNNIPAGTIPAFGRLANIPDPNNARYYPDQAGGGVQIDVDPNPNSEFFITRHNFNTVNPLAGDAVVERAEDLLMRHAQWMVQEIGVDGFRLDAVKHLPTSTLTLLDQAVFRASNQLNHDGSVKPTFTFGEVFDGSKGTVQNYINKSLSNPNGIDQADFEVKGHRDALDFPLFFPMRDNLSGVTAQNNWHGIRNATQDTQDDGLRNGSQGVSFVDSHDNIPGGFPFLKNVAYAYTLMRPGQANVYFNANEFGERTNNFPNQGKDDALGGFFGDAVTTLVNLRNTHGRGNFNERWIDEAFGDDDGNGFQDSNVYIYERGNSAIVGLSNSVEAGFEERSPVATEFQAGLVLVELTGNAADPIVDPGGNIPETIRVAPSGRPDGTGDVTIRIPRNDGHDRGYVVYGLPGPQGSLSVTNVASVLLGATPSEASNGTARLTDIDVITGDSFSVRVDTTPVTLAAPFGETQAYRDFDADGDTAQIRIDDGIDLNGNSVIDHTTPGGVSYGFEEFSDTRTPGFIDNGGSNIGTGTGLYEQTIDATQLGEGRHFVTVRAFRHRDSGTGGDGGPAIFTDFRRTVYIDRVAPESEFVSFEPFPNAPQNTEDRDLIVRSVDATANQVSIFRDLSLNFSEQTLLSLAAGGFDAAGQHDRDSWIRGFHDLTTGNHVFTVVMFEETGNFTIRRIAGLLVDDGVGAGFGDINFNGVVQTSDIDGAFSVESILYSQNNQFNPSFDVNGDGLGDNRDLFALEGEFATQGVGGDVLRAYNDLLVRRGDVDQSGTTTTGDFDALYNNFGSDDWFFDLDVDGTTDIDDVKTMVMDILRTVPGDIDLNGIVDAADVAIWQLNDGTASGGRYTQGDVDFDGDVDADDRAIIDGNLGFIGAVAIARADYNADGIVTAGDYTAWLDSLGSTTNLAADGDQDGIIGQGDYAFWRQLFGNSLLAISSPGNSTNGTNIPEPTSAWLFGLVFSSMFFCNRSRTTRN